MSGQRWRLVDVAHIIRSKNAGPFRLTLDVILRSQEDYDRVLRSGCLAPHRVAALYGMLLDDIVSYVEYEPALAIKITMQRKVGAGGPGERDVYGCQQHAPLLAVTFGDEEGPRVPGGKE